MLVGGRRAGPHRPDGVEQPRQHGRAVSVSDKVMASLFQSVSTRTAGMNTIDLAACGPITKLLMSVLQFIGAAPGSTGGGVKVTTFAVLYPDHPQRGAGPG